MIVKKILYLCNSLVERDQNNIQKGRCSWVRCGNNFDPSHLHKSNKLQRQCTSSKHCNYKASNLAMLEDRRNSHKSGRYTIDLLVLTSFNFKHLHSTDRKLNLCNYNIIEGKLNILRIIYRINSDILYKQFTYTIILL